MPSSTKNNNTGTFNPRNGGGGPSDKEKNKNLKRKAKCFSQSSQTKNKLLKSNSLNAIPLDDCSRDDKVFGVCANCSLDIGGLEERYFMCDVCSDKFHNDCLDIDADSVDLIFAVVESIGWICYDCRVFAKQCKRGKNLSLKTNPSDKGSFKNDNSELLRAMDDLTKRFAVLEKSVAFLLEERQMKSTETSDIRILNAPPSSDYARSTYKSDAMASTIAEVPKPVNLIEVHKLLLDTDRRKRNVVVSGLEQLSGRDDSVSFSDLCYSHMSISVDPKSIRCRRVGKDQKLLVQLGSEPVASAILARARSLRNSTDPRIRDRVYINKDVTPEESKLMYEQRVRRRNRGAKLTPKEGAIDGQGTAPLVMSTVDFPQLPPPHYSTSQLYPYGHGPVQSQGMIYIPAGIPSTSVSGSGLSYHNHGTTFAIQNIPLSHPTAAVGCSPIYASSNIGHPFDSHLASTQDPVAGCSHSSIPIVQSASSQG